jgi:SCP1.201-like deaminase
VRRAGSGRAGRARRLRRLRGPEAGRARPELGGATTATRRAAQGQATTGLFFDSSPDSYTALSSGTDDLSERAAEILNDAGVSDVNLTHVETKIAAKMRDNEIAFGVLVINNTFVCGGPDAPGCRGALPVILLEGATLYVWAKDARSVLIFKGRGA